jgi:NAD(P)-dependent dehydrogenase (short-subunit alcohol dehydrogenase family)
MPRPARTYDRLAGLTALVTGAGSEGEGFGVGRAIAVLFAQEGARLALADLDRGRAEATLRLVEAAGGEGCVVTGDVTEPEACGEMAAGAVERFGGVDILVNNVGVVTQGGRVEDLDLADWRRGLECNYVGAFLMTRATLPHLLKSRGKAVVNIASIAGLRAYGATSYGPAKAALIQFTRELAVLYGREGLRANVIAPGHIMTPLAQTFMDPALRETRRRIAPLNLEGDAWDVAQAALFLAGAEARFITGVCLPVDGGAIEIGPISAHQRMLREAR